MRPHKNPLQPIGSMGLAYLATWMVDLYEIHVGKYTSAMDPNKKQPTTLKFKKRLDLQNLDWLVVSTHLKSISQIGSIFLRVRVENSKIHLSCHQLEIGLTIKTIFFFEILLCDEIGVFKPNLSLRILTNLPDRRGLFGTTNPIRKE